MKRKGLSCLAAAIILGTAVFAGTAAHAEDFYKDRRSASSWATPPGAATTPTRA